MAGTVSVLANDKGSEGMEYQPPQTVTEPSLEQMMAMYKSRFTPPKKPGPTNSSYLTLHGLLGKDRWKWVGEDRRGCWNIFVDQKYSRKQNLKNKDGIVKVRYYYESGAENCHWTPDYMFEKRPASSWLYSGEEINCKTGESRYKYKNDPDWSPDRRHFRLVPNVCHYLLWQYNTQPDTNVQTNPQ